nr:hypothetical protein [Candidatus Sigynarchaeota archaeon]
MNTEEDDPPEKVLEDAIADYSRRYGMSREEVMVRIACPICGKNKKIAVDKEMVLDSPGMVLTYPVVKGVICEHAFIAKIDSHFKAR